jgi:hypothetical protein
MDIPTAEQIKAARGELGQREAAELVYAPSYRTWQNWELGKNTMAPAVWELFLLKTDQHPSLRLIKRRRKEEQNEARANDRLASGGGDLGDGSR